MRRLDIHGAPATDQRAFCFLLQKDLLIPAGTGRRCTGAVRVGVAAAKRLEGLQSCSMFSSIAFRARMAFIELVPNVYRVSASNVP